MKKSFRILLTLVLAVVMVLSLTACISNCATGMHDFVEVPAKEATCTQAGNVAYKKCKVCNLYVDATGKKISANSVDIPAGHSYVKHSAEPASCTEAGNAEYYTCDKCNTIFDADKVAIEKLPEIPATHTFGEWVDEKPATCTETGTKGHKDCSVCNKHFDADGKELETIEIAVNPSAHTFGEWVDEKPATCTETGTKGHKDCSVCNKHFDADGKEIPDLAISKTAHTYAEVEDSKYLVSAATCKGYAVYYKSCTCGAQSTETFNGNTYAAHTFGEWIDEKPATCQETGELGHYYCSVCEKNLADDKTTVLGSLTIDKNSNNHADLTPVSGTSATCESAGTLAHDECACGALLIDGEVVTSVVDPQKKHNLTKTEAKAATCTEAGNIEYWYCSTCKKNYDASNKEITTSVTLAKTAHTYDQQVTTDIFLKDSATCTAKAKYYYSCECGAKGTETFTDEESELASHNYDQEVVHADYLKTAATCTAKAVYYKSCTCGAKGTETDTFESGDALGHDEQSHDAKAPTCTEVGCDAYVTCKREGCAYSTKVEKPATGHVNTTHNNGTSATCESAGTLAHDECACGALLIDGEVVTSVVDPQKAHNLTKTEAKAATCTEAGNVQYWTCSTCPNKFSNAEGTTIVTDVAIPKASHTAKETWESDANGHWKICSVCETTVVTKASHNWKSGATEPTETQHFGNECEDCGYKSQPADHSAGVAWQHETVDGKIYHYQYCGGCNYQGTKFNRGECNLVHTEAKAATCVAQGNYEYYHCDGCDTYFNSSMQVTTLVALTCPVDTTNGHKPASTWTVGTDGKHYHACQNEGCDAHLDEASHNYDQEVVHADYLKTAATCTAKAVYYKSCTCGAKGTDADTFSYTAGGYATHTFGEWVAEKPATCSATGTKAHKDCSVCNKHFDADGEEITNLTIPVDTTNGHKSATDWSTTEDGKHYHECNNEGCDAHLDEAPHVAQGDWQSDDTNHWTLCECGEIVGKTAHDVTDVDLSHDSTNHWKVCIICSAEVGKTAHDGVAKFDETDHWTECSVCGEITVAKASHSVSGGKCTAEGCPFIKATSTVTLTSIPDANQTAGELSNNATTTEIYFVLGRIDSIQNETYGNVTIKDANGNSIKTYGLYTYDDVRYDAMTTKPVVGDVIVVYGQLTKYNSNAQVKNAVLLEHNGTVQITAQDILNNITVRETIEEQEYDLPMELAAISWTSSNNEVFAIDNTTGKATITASKTANTTVTLTATVIFNGETVTRDFTVTIPRDTGKRTVVWTATDYELERAESVNDSAFTLNNNAITITFKGTGTNSPAFYEDAIRLYKNGTLTVAAGADKTILTIKLSSGDGDGSSAITVNSGTLSEKIWNGSANSVVFSVAGTRRIASIEVTYCSHEATEIQSIEGNSQQHKKVCAGCGTQIELEDHSFTYQSISDSQHSVTCACGYTINADHVYENHACKDCGHAEPSFTVTVEAPEGVTVTLSGTNVEGETNKFYQNTTVTVTVTGVADNYIAEAEFITVVVTLSGDGVGTFNITESGILKITCTPKAEAHNCEFTKFIRCTNTEHTFGCSHSGCIQQQTTNHSMTAYENTSETEHTVKCATVGCTHSYTESHTYGEEHQCVCEKEEPTVCITIDNQTNGVVTVAMSVDGQLTERTQYTYYVGTSVTLTITLTDNTKVATVKQGETEITLTNNAYTFDATADATFVITVADKPATKTVKVDLTEKFSTYASQWNTSYSDRTIDAKSLGISDVDFSVKFTGASKQSSANAQIDNMPVVASKAKDQYVTISVENLHIKSATFNLKQWSTKKFAKLMLEYTTNGTTWTAVEGVGQNGTSNSYFASELLTGDLPENVTAVRLHIYATGSSNVQIGINGFTIDVE